MSRPACSGCGHEPPANARYCPVCARALLPEASATVTAARESADVRRQRDRLAVDDLLRAYDLRPAAGAPTGAADAARTVASTTAPAAAGVVAHAAHAADVEAGGAFEETISPGVNPLLAESWRAAIRMERQLFPSWIVSTAVAHPGDLARVEAEAFGMEFLGDPEGLVGAYVKSPRDGAPVRVTVDVGDIGRTSVYEGVLPRGGSSYAVFPKVKYDYAALLDTRQQRPVDVTVRVDLDGTAVGESTETCMLRSINDCPLGMSFEGPSQRHIRDLAYMFAAYVNEDHPWIEGLLKEALQKGIVERFFVTPQTSPDAIVAQVYAVWSVLRGRGVKYSNITATPGGRGCVACQHVRFVDDSIRHSQANCADGSVLLASVLRKIGVQPYLIYVPGHMYLAFALSETERPVADGHARLTHLFGIETTIIGEGGFEPSPSWVEKSPGCLVMRPLPWLGIERGGPQFEFTRAERMISEAGIAKHARLDRDDWRNFFAAVEHGTANLAAGYVDLRDNQPRDFQILRVTDARDAGLMPLAYRAAHDAVPPAQEDR